MIDLRRADAAARDAATILGKRSMPAPYPHDPVAQAVDATAHRGRRELDALLINTRDGAIRLLKDAVDLEEDARRAQTKAVEALRHIGGASLSWEQIGRLLGISGAGAHKRLRSVEGPVAQRTIDELERELNSQTQEPQA